MASNMVSIISATGRNHAMMLPTTDTKGDVVNTLSKDSCLYNLVKPVYKNNIIRRLMHMFSIISCFIIINFYNGGCNISFAYWLIKVDKITGKCSCPIGIIYCPYGIIYCARTSKSRDRPSKRQWKKYLGSAEKVKLSFKISNFPSFKLANFLIIISNSFIWVAACLHPDNIRQKSTCPVNLTRFSTITIAAI